jgi:FtsP/CotA-like multicopper oxidase with cupredoxin domain
MPKRPLSLLVAALVVLAGAASWLAFGRAADALTPVRPGDPAVTSAEAARALQGSSTKTVTLTAAPATVRLGGRTVQTWAFNGQVPGPELRLAAGDTLRATVVNRLPQPLTMHWHGIALRNDMDGVPDVTQPPIATGGSFTYTFTVPHAGTFWYHPHTGVQLDRGLYGPLIVTPRVPDGVRDLPVLLDDWTDGLAENPDQVLARLRAGATGSPGSSGHDMSSMQHEMAGMDMGDGMPMSGTHEDTGDVTYPAYLANGRTPDSPAVYDVRPGQRVRLRLIDAGADTTFQVAAAGSRLTVVATDGYDVQPVTVDTLKLAMGERYDVELTAPASGVLPVVALADGKKGQALVVLRVSGSALPTADLRPAELAGRQLRLSDLHATAQDALADRAPDRTYRVQLTGGMARYDWGLRVPRVDGVTMPVRQGQRVRLVFTNLTMMAHPIHLHGHTFQVVSRSGTGPRKDTVLVPAMGTVTVDLDADNPGQWMLHCHNAYHGAAGMMTQLSYVR